MLRVSAISVVCILILSHPTLLQTQKTKRRVAPARAFLMYNHTRRKKKDPEVSLPPPPTTASASTKMASPSKMLTLTPSRVKNILLLLSFLVILFLLLYNPFLHAPSSLFLRGDISPSTRRRHLLFVIASSYASWPRRKPYIGLWYEPNSTRALAFLDRSVPHDPALPQVVVSGDTSRFPYTFPGGLRSAIRVARVVKEAVDRNEPDVRWFVFGDDDTVFLVDNLVAVLSKYNHEKWFYVGSNSESYEQNVKHSFSMAFGGGGFAISSSLARVLAGVLDSCLMRYSHLYGSDLRVFSCLAELGVGLTHEAGFHQVDMRGNLFGMLSAHPLSPLLSLHHLDAVEPIFPNMNKTQALERFFKAVHVDPARTLQQTVCYDSLNSLSISIAWGYAIQVFEGNELLPNLLMLQKTFTPWKKGARVQHNYMFNTREYHRDPCERPVVFFLESIVSGKNSARSNYTRHVVGNCVKGKAIKSLEQIRVFSQKLNFDIDQMKAPRRSCCDILPLYNESMVIYIRQCGPVERISMH